MLTPADYGDNGKLHLCKLNKNDYDFLEHDQCLCTHPHHGHKSKVVDSYWDKYASTIESVCWVHWSCDEKYKNKYIHEQERDAELNMIRCDIFCSKSSEIKYKSTINFTLKILVLRCQSNFSTYLLESEHCNSSHCETNNRHHYAHVWDEWEMCFNHGINR